MTQEAIALRTSGGAYPGLEVVQDVNKALDTIATDFAGASDPEALAGPYMTWADTASGLLKRRNAAGSAWVAVGPLLSYGSPSLTFKAAPSAAADDVVVQSQVLGISQDWVDVTGSRVIGTIYTNLTSKPIWVSVYIISIVGGALGDQLVIGGKIRSYFIVGPVSVAASAVGTVCGLVLPGQQYYISHVTGTAASFAWHEIRGV